MTDQTLHCREAFEKWYWSEVRDLSFSQARQGWEAACEWMNTRAQSSAPEGGEAVAWQYRSITDEGPSPYWRECTKKWADLMSGDKYTEVRPLYTLSSAHGGEPSDADALSLVAAFRKVPIDYVTRTEIDHIKACMSALSTSRSNDKGTEGG
jgi:hypothetical protein